MELQCAPSARFRIIFRTQVRVSVTAALSGTVGVGARAKAATVGLRRFVAEIYTRLWVIPAGSGRGSGP